MKYKYVKAFPWFLAAVIAFYFIAIKGSEYQQEHEAWPQYKAEIVATKITWAAHMTDEYSLLIILNVHPENNTLAYQASLVQVGPKGALEKRAADKYALGNWLKVRSNPDDPQHIELISTGGWGAYIVGTIISLLILLNGFTILYAQPKEKNKNHHLDG
jgi:hypothetical protein